MTEEKMVQIFKSLSDSNRLKILNYLGKGELCACELLEYLDISQSTLSYHMKNLIETDLILVRQVGKWSYYRINKEVFYGFKDYVKGLKYSNIMRKEC
ncbi:metalloregulator ArsR/SmtB family transcription factor [Lagierella sp.]|uniref:ArsR/SmtB family transcription factor n=1 Tax=Lagierella sp. TaxID=2849657 RepID=UPI0026224AE8|nr:metalloregulator ArsR/SmtB family transcription factor [Lagierella sp.]